MKACEGDGGANDDAPRLAWPKAFTLPYGGACLGLCCLCGWRRKLCLLPESELIYCSVGVESWSVTGCSGEIRLLSERN